MEKIIPLIPAGAVEIPIAPGYWALPDGAIWSSRRSKFLSTTYRDVKGYPCVSIMVKNKTVKRPVHRLICTAFAPDGALEGLQVRHLDGNKTNNTVANLAWGTPKQNSADTIRQGRQLSKLTEHQVRAIRLLWAYGVLQRRIAEIFHIGRQNVSCIVLRKTWSHI